MFKKLLSLLALVVMVSILHVLPASAFDIDQVITDFEQSENPVDFGLLDAVAEAPDIVALVPTYINNQTAHNGAILAVRYELIMVDAHTSESEVGFIASYSMPVIA